MRPAATVHALPADTDDAAPNGWRAHQSMVERAAVRARMRVPLQAGCSACVTGTLPASLHACVCTDDSGRSVLSACAKSPERHARREVRFVQREIGSGTGIGPVPYRQVMTIRAVSTSVRRHLGAAPVDWRSGRTLRWTCEGTCRRQDGAGSEQRLAGNTQQRTLCVASKPLLASGNVFGAACTLTGAGSAE